MGLAVIVITIVLTTLMGTMVTDPFPHSAVWVYPITNLEEEASLLPQIPTVIITIATTTRIREITITDLDPECHLLITKWG
jgi:hypothetical protein